MEIGAGYKTWDYDSVGVLPGPTLSAGREQMGVNGGIYYTPADQLTIGLEASWLNSEGDFAQRNDVAGLRFTKETTATTVDLVSVWRF